MNDKVKKAQELEAESKRLAEKAAQVRNDARESVKRELIETARAAGYDINELFGFKKAKATGDGRKAVAVKYRNAEGQTWTGRGKRPNWLTAALAGGASLESFAV